MWDLIVSVPDHCLSFYLTEVACQRFVLVVFLLLFVLSNLCATPTSAIMVRHDREQYRQKERQVIIHYRWGSPVRKCLSFLYCSIPS